MQPRGNSTLFQDAAANLRRDGQLRNLTPAAFNPPTGVYSVQVDPDQFDTTVPDQLATRAAFEKIPTSWTMSAGEFRTVQDTAHRLLYLHPCFVRLVMLRSTETPEALAGGAALGDPAKCDFDAQAQPLIAPSGRSAVALH